jgi:5'-3' exonuclease
MILVDLNQVLISNLMAQTRGKAENLPNKEMIRHMVINSLRGFNLKFKSEYGNNIVLCADAGEPWRRDIYPNYKHARRKGRVDSATDWDNIFNIITEIKHEIAENFPYVMMYIEKAEADDIIATLVKHINEPIMIISGDKDFIQLQTKINVKQYSPIQKKFVGEGIDPKIFLHEQIIKGDRSDGIPNILSPDDIFLTGEKQRPINKKRLEEWSSVDKIPLGSETSKYFERNKRLIDLSCIPQELERTIINTYKDYKIPSRSKLLPYFMKHKLKSLMENIGDF